MEWLVMDMLDLKYADASVDIALDKGIPILFDRSYSKEHLMRCSQTTLLS